MKTIRNFAFGADLTFGLTMAACMLLGISIFLFELGTGTEFPKAAPGSWRALVLIGCFQMIAGGIAAAIAKEPS